MRKRDKIRILKKALKSLEREHADGEYETGICLAIGLANMYKWMTCEAVGITLPRERYGPLRMYCWPLNKRGAAIRRRVLKNAIKRLEK